MTTAEFGWVLQFSANFRSEYLEGQHSSVLSNTNNSDSKSSNSKALLPISRYSNNANGNPWGFIFVCLGGMDSC